MNNPTMLYRCPGPHEIHGGKFDYVIVDEDEVAGKLQEGWFATTGEAKEAHEASLIDGDSKDDESAPTRAELEAKATELGIKFDGRTKDKALADKIEAALKG